MRLKYTIRSLRLDERHRMYEVDPILPSGCIKCEFTKGSGQCWKR